MDRGSSRRTKGCLKAAMFKIDEPLGGDGRGREKIWIEQCEESMSFDE